MATIYPKNNSFSSEYKRDLSSKSILKKREDMEYPLDIEKIINDYNIIICKEDMDYDISGYIEKRETQWVIGVNKYHSPQRQRFYISS